MLQTYVSIILNAALILMLLGVLQILEYSTISHPDSGKIHDLFESLQRKLVQLLPVCPSHAMPISLQQSQDEFRYKFVGGQWGAPRSGLTLPPGPIQLVQLKHCQKPASM